MNPRRLTDPGRGSRQRYPTIAFHQYLTVPAHAASHGCVRQVPAVAHMTYDFADVGMRVDVFGRT